MKIFSCQGKVGRKPAFFFMKNEEPTYQDHIEQQIAELSEPVLLDLGYELVEVQFRKEAHGQVLRLVIYNDKGIGLDDCSRVSREISIILDVEDFLDQAYTLEVSSPGLDRLLKTERDFKRCIGKKVKLILHDGSDDLIGTVKGVGEDKVVIESEDGPQDVSLCEINKARLVIGF